MIQLVERTYPHELEITERTLEPKQEEDVVRFRYACKPEGEETDAGYIIACYDKEEKTLLLIDKLTKPVSKEEFQVLAAKIALDVHPNWTLLFAQNETLPENKRHKETPLVSLDELIVQHFEGEGRCEYQKGESQWADFLEKKRQSFTYYDRHKETRAKIKGFLEQLNVSKRTKETYYYSLEGFFEWLLENHYDSYADYDEDTLNAYIRHLLHEKKRTPLYVRRTLNTVIQYSAFIGRAIDREKAMKEDLPDIPKPGELPQRHYSQAYAEYGQRFLEGRLQSARRLAVDKSHELRTGGIRDHWRNLLIYRLNLECLLLLGEAVKLDKSDVYLNESTPYLLIREKKKQTRKVPIPQGLAGELQAYIHWRNANDYRIEVEKQLRHCRKGRQMNIDGQTCTVQDIATEEEYQRITEMQEMIDDSKKLDSPVKGINGTELKNKIESIIRGAIERTVSATFVNPNPLFISNRGVRVSGVTIQVVFMEIGHEKTKDGTWEKGLHPVESMKLRHTGIHRMLEENIPVHYIQSITGIESLDIIKRYAHPTLEETATVLNTLHAK